MAELGVEVARHRQFLLESGDWIRREQTRIEVELENLLQAALVARWRENFSSDRYHQILTELVGRSISPYQAVSQMLEN